MSAQGPKHDTAATRLTRIARERYELLHDPAGEPFAVPVDGAKLVVMLRGARSLRVELAAAYLQLHDAPPSQQALADALAALEGLALAGPCRPLALRVAEHEGVLWLDLGDEQGRVVRVDESGWQVLAESPVLHRRTALSAAMPEPRRREQPGTVTDPLASLWALLNVAERDRGLLAAFLVAALLPGIPHPILALVGEQGTGKSTAARIIASVIDPSTVPLRKPPKDLEAWTTAAMGSHVVAVDNLSVMPDWLSDALCRASTGDGDVRRRLYSDADLHVVSFRRVVLVTGIDLGTVRDDLADRLVMVELDRIEETGRRTDADLARQWEAVAPVVLAGLLDLTAAVLATLPGLQLERLPRMADFARVVAAVDTVTGSTALDRYRALSGDLARDAVTSDPVLVALTAFVVGTWTGAMADLHEGLTGTLGDTRPGRGWPANARALGTVLKRRAPSLRRVGWTVEQTSQRCERGALWRLTKPDETEPPSVSSGSRQASRQPEAPAMTSDNAESAANPDGMTRQTPNLGLVPRTEKEKESCGDQSSSRHLVSQCHLHPTPRPADCWTCEHSAGVA